MKNGVYSAAQVAQHAELGSDLQKGNAHAAHILLRLGRMPLQLHRFNALCEELTSLGRSMTLQMFLCEQIADSGRGRHYDVINVIFGTTCDRCLESGKAQLRTNRPQAEVLTSSQAWAIQVERLVGLMILVAHKISQTSSSPRRSVEPALRSFAGLSKLLSRQRRHLQHISVQRPTEINVIEDRGAVCPDCQHPYPPCATDGEDR
jgi:hypothetical protein